MPRVLKAVGMHLTEDVVKIHDVMPIGNKVKQAPIRLAVDEDVEDGPVLIRDVTTIGHSEGDYADEEDFQPEEFENLSGGAHVVQKAREEAEMLLENAMREAEVERAEILARTQQEADEMRQQAHMEGRQEGYASVTEQMRETAEKLESTVARLEGEQAGFEAEYEDQLQWAALEIASKVLNQKIAEDDTMMTSMVEKAIQNMRNEPWIRVEVAQDMTHLIGHLTDMYEDMEHIDISPIPADSGTVLLETASGVTDASLKTQFENLKTYFQRAGI